MYYYKYPINYLPNQAGDTTAFAVKQLIQERNYIYQILNNIVAGNTAFMKVGVLVATNDNIALSGEQEIDGVKVADGDRVLVWKQTDATQNGVYTVGAGEWKRAEDADDDADFATGFFIGVTRGEYAGQLFTQYGDVEIDKKPLLFRNIIQGDKVTQEILEAQKKAENASLSAITAADSAKENAEKAKTAKFNAQVIANKVATNVQAAEMARAGAVAAQAETKKDKEHVSRISGEIINKQKELDAMQDKTRNSQRQLNAKQDEIAAAQERAGELLKKAQLAQSDIEHDISAIKTAEENARRAADRAEESQKRVSESASNAEILYSNSTRLAEEIKKTHSEISEKVRVANEINAQTKAATEAASDTYKETAQIKEQVQQTRNEVTAAMEQANENIQRTQKHIEQIQQAAEATQESRAAAEKLHAGTKAAADKADNAQKAAKASEDKAKEYMELAKDYSNIDLSKYATKVDVETKHGEIMREVERLSELNRASREEVIALFDGLIIGGGSTGGEPTVPKGEIATDGDIENLFNAHTAA